MVSVGEHDARTIIVNVGDRFQFYRFYSK